MTNERRQKPRTKIRGMFYIHIAPDYSAVVLDISEGGLCFQADAPVLNSGAIHFGFLSSLRGRIDAEGEIAWQSADNKMGGLRFTRMTPAAWGCVYELLGGVLASSAEQKPAEAFASVGASNAKPQERTSSRPNMFVAPERQPSPPSVAAAPEAEVSFLLPSADSLEDEWKSARKQGFFRGLAIGIVVAALAVAGLLAAKTYEGNIHKQFADLTGQPAATSSSEPQTVPLNPQALPDPAADVPARGGALDGAFANAPAAPNSTDPASAALLPPNEPAASNATPNATDPTEILPPVANLNGAPKPTSPSSAPETSPTRSETRTAQASVAPLSRGTSLTSKTSSRDTELRQADAIRAEEDGQQELDAADKILRSGNRPNFATAAQWLWAAVKNGNAQAEVELSDLYSSGEGVPRNCEQARILLRAAAAKGNAEARERLQSASPGGCRS